MSQIDFELCSILALERPRPPRIVTVIKSNCSLSWKRTSLWRTQRFLHLGTGSFQKILNAEVWYSDLHRFRRNIGPAKRNNMANYIVINKHQQFCKLSWHLSIFEPDCLTSVSNWQDEDEETALELAHEYKTKTPACRQHPSAHEAIVKLLSSDEPVAEQFWLGVSWMNLTRQNRPPWECFPLALGQR